MTFKCDLKLCTQLPLVTGGDEEEELLRCRLKLCAQENGCLAYKESSIKRCCIKTEHQEGLLVERENLVSLGIVSCTPISAAVSCQLPSLSPHRGLLPLSLTWLGKQQSGVGAGCWWAVLVVVFQGTA